MAEQLIISIGREFGSGGHEIAEMLAKKFDLPLYDKNLLHEMAQHNNMNAAELEKYDELPKNKLLSRRVKGYSNSPEENIANMQFEHLRKMAAEGKSFVIVGRCSEVILKEYVGKGLVRIFVLADLACKVKRISDYEHVSEREAQDMLERSNRKRKQYHNHYCDSKWGDSRNYDICINSSRLGLEKTAEYLEGYINAVVGE